MKNITLNSKEYAKLQNWATANKITFMARGDKGGYFNWAKGPLVLAGDKGFAAKNEIRDGWKVLENMAALVAAWKA